MKDFVLSLLSRGYAQFVPAEDGHDGRLEVCFEPEDYFNWKSQPPLLRLTRSGHFFGGLEPVPPKTYSTRRGPLILYSEDLAHAYQSGQVKRKRKAQSCPKQEVEKQLHTLQDLTGAILAFGKKKTKAGSLSEVKHPLLPAAKPATQTIHIHHRPADKCCNSRLVKGEKVGEVRYNPRFFSSPRSNQPTQDPLPPITEGLVHIQVQDKTSTIPDEQITFKPKEEKDQLKEQPKDRKRLKNVRIAINTCHTQIIPTPETETALNQTEDEAVTLAASTNPSTILPHLTDRPKDLNGRGKRSRVEGGRAVGEMSTLRSVYVDSSLDYSPISRVNYYGGHMEGSRQIRHCEDESHLRRVNTETDPSLTVFHLPQINQNPLVNSNSDITLPMNIPEIKEVRSYENVPQRELHMHLPAIKVQTAHDGPSERRIQSKVLLLFPEQTQHTDTLPPHDELSRSPVKETEPCGNVENKEKTGQNLLPDSKCRVIEMDLGHVMGSDYLEKGDQPLPVGPLPPLLGRRGPGKQSSMAVYRQSLQEPIDTTEPQTGHTRGCIPLELREWQEGKAVGTLIMGPDGEIIRLSLWDPTVDTEDHPIMAEATQAHVLKVVTSEGDLKQPWTILLQDQDTDEEEVSSNSEESTWEQLDSSHEVFKVNKAAEKTNAKKRQRLLGSYSQHIQEAQVNIDGEISVEEEEENEEEETDEEEDYLSSDSKLNANARIFGKKAHTRQPNAEDDDDDDDDDEEEEFDSNSPKSKEKRVIKVRSHAKRLKAKRKEDCLGLFAKNEINQEEKEIKVRSHAKKNKIKKDEDYLDTDSEIFQKTQVRSRTKQTKIKRKENRLDDNNEIVQEEQIKVRSRAKQSKVKKEEDFFSSDSEIVQDEQVYLPEERLEEMISSTTQQLKKTGEEVTGEQRNRRVKTTTLQPETGVTQRSRKSKGATPAINPKSTHFTARAYSPESLSLEGQTEIQTGLPAAAEKEQSKSSRGRDDTEDKLLERVKKNKTTNKQTGKSKGKTVQIQEDAETQNTSVPDVPSSTSKKKKMKTEKVKIEETEEEKVDHSKTKNSLLKAKKKKKGQPAFVVGKPQPQQAEWMTNAEDEPETQMSHEKAVSSNNTEDTQLENTQDHSYIDSGDELDAYTDSESSYTHADSFRSVYSIRRSQHSLITARSDVSLHGPSQTSIRSSSTGTAAHCGPAQLSLIHLPPQSAGSALLPALDYNKSEPDPTKSDRGHSIKSSEAPNDPADKKAALTERAERRRLEVEKKRREKEEEKKRQLEKEATEERMRLELEEEQRKRSEEARLQRIREDEERQRRLAEEMERQRREQAEKDRERRRQEEKRRLLERLQRERQQEEKRQAVELERQRLEEEARREEECRKLSEMEETERMEYLRRQQEEEEEKRRAAEERRRREEEAAASAELEARLQAQLFARQRAALEQQLKFHRGLFVEAEGLEQTQDISRPWVFSYFTLLKLLGLAEPTSDDVLKDML